MTLAGSAFFSVFTVSFANFASIGIIAGAIKGLNEPRGNIVSRFGLRLVYSATLVSLLSASFAGLVLGNKRRAAPPFTQNCTQTGWSTRITDSCAKRDL